MSEIFEIIEGDRVRIVKEVVHTELNGKKGKVAKTVGHGSLCVELDSGGYIYVNENSVVLDFSPEGSK